MRGCAGVGAATWKTAQARNERTISTIDVFIAARHGSPPSTSQWENIQPPANEPTRMAVMVAISM